MSFQLNGFQLDHLLRCAAALDQAGQLQKFVEPHRTLPIASETIPFASS